MGEIPFPFFKKTLIPLWYIFRIHVILVITQRK